MEGEGRRPSASRTSKVNGRQAAERAKAEVGDMVNGKCDSAEVRRWLEYMYDYTVPRSGRGLTAFLKAADFESVPYASKGKRGRSGTVWKCRVSGTRGTMFGLNRRLGGMADK